MITNVSNRNVVTIQHEKTDYRKELKSSLILSWARKQASYKGKYEAVLPRS